jgi:ubiquitin
MGMPPAGGSYQGSQSSQMGMPPAGGSYQGSQSSQMGMPPAGGSYQGSQSTSEGHMVNPSDIFPQAHQVLLLSREAFSNSCE